MRGLIGLAGLGLACLPLSARAAETKQAASASCRTIGAIASSGLAIFDARDLFHGEARTVKVDIDNDGTLVDVYAGSQGTAHFPELETPDRNALDTAAEREFGGDDIRFFRKLALIDINGRIWTVAYDPDEGTSTVRLEAASDGQFLCAYESHVLSSSVVFAPGTTAADKAFYQAVLLHQSGQLASVTDDLSAESWNKISPGFGLVGPGEPTGRAWKVRMAAEKQPQTLSEISVSWGGGPGCDMNLLAWIDGGRTRAIWPVWAPDVLKDTARGAGSLGQALPWDTLCESQATPIEGPAGRNFVLLSRMRPTEDNDARFLIEVTAGVSEHGQVVAHTAPKLVNTLVSTE